MKLFNWFSRKRKDLIATKYDAAQTSHENKRHWAMSDGYSADTSLTPDVRRILRNRSRYETANNAYAKGMVLTVAGDTIGTGPRPQVQTEDNELNRRIERAFAVWSAEVHLAEKLRAMRLAKAIDGEAFAILFNNPKLSCPVKLDLKLIEAERVTSPLTEWDWHKLVDGIEFDDFDNPLLYYVLRYHPGDSHGGMEEFETIPADSIIHWFRLDRPEQHRGLPELTPALPLFAQLRRYTLAVLASAETAADFAAVIYTDAPAGGEATPATPFDIVSLEKRMATTLPDGWKLGQLKAEQPTTNYPQFKREILGEIGRVLQVPINVVTGDSSQHNYASGRLDHQTYHRAIRIEQDTCASVVLDRIFKNWYREFSLLTSQKPVDALATQYDSDMNSCYIEAGKKPTLDRVSVRWFWDGFEHVDPAKEANAQEKRLSNYTTTLATEYAKLGKDWEEELRQLAREKALMKELDLVNDPTVEPVKKPVEEKEEDHTETEE